MISPEGLYSPSVVRKSGLGLATHDKYAGTSRGLRNATVRNMLLFGSCAWEIFGSAGFSICPVRQPAYSYHLIRLATTKKVINQMEFKK